MDETQEDRIARYVTRRCTREEEAEIRQWIDADPDREAMANSLQQVWELGELPLSRWNSQAAWAELSARHAVRQDDDVSPASLPFAPMSSSWRRRWPTATTWSLRAAAAVVLLIGAVQIWRRIA